MRFVLGIVLLLVGTLAAAMGYAAVDGGVGRGSIGFGLLAGAAVVLVAAWRLMAQPASEGG